VFPSAGEACRDRWSVWRSEAAAAEPSVIAPLSRELQKTMQWIMRDVWPSVDPVDDLRARRDRKRMNLPD